MKDFINFNKVPVKTDFEFLSTAGKETIKSQIINILDNLVSLKPLEAFCAMFLSRKRGQGLYFNNSFGEDVLIDI